MSNENTTYINYLIEISKSGRQRGFLDLCEIILPNIYTVVFRLVNDAGLAKKITADVLMRAWGEIKTFDMRKSFIEWIKSIAIFLAMDELTKNSNLFQNAAGEENRDLKTKDLENLIKLLSPINRVIFVLHDLEGYSYREIVRFFPELIEDELKTNLIQTRQYLIGNITQ